ncbi:MAG TPA: ABC transporter substrate-binding protein [Rhodospirillales bacterium]|jgi:phospholipid transport system substrate-binding protein|nr:ABC transporter substrate-binding protein [Rhodospirillales bacterium]|tara:strand:+ start:522 stop:1229 length:708 start_codon:yes stop_codon:yes gene_type:complete
MQKIGFSNFLLILALAALPLGGCAEAWKDFSKSFTPDGQEQNIKESDIAALTNFDTAAGSGNELNAANLYIEKLSKEVITVLTDTSKSQDQRIKFFGGLLARDLNIPLIARFTVGNHWRSAKPEERKAYVTIFSDYIIQTYSSRLGGAKVEKFDIVNTQAVGKRDILVRTRVRNSGSNPIRADWRLRANEGQFQIIDLSVEGISMALMLRKEFASVLRQKGGINGLIQILKQRTA